MLILRKICHFVTCILIFCLFLSFLPFSTVSAAINPEDTEANALKELHIFLGDGNGFALDDRPTRVEASVVILRLIGKENEAIELNLEHHFDDVPVWANAQIGYLYQNGLINGKTNSLFGNELIDFNQMMTLILRVLGYDDNSGDFTWSSAAVKSEELSVISQRCFSKVNENEEFTRKDLVSCVYCALQGKIKNSQDTLIKKLLSEGVINEQQIRNTGCSRLLAAANLSTITAQHCYLNQEFTIKPNYSKSALTIKVNLPDDYINRQKVISHTFSIEPSGYFYDDGGLYALFDFINIKETTVLKITTEIEIYEYGLSAAQNHHFPIQLSDSDREKYTSPDEWIESDDPAFKTTITGLSDNSGDIDKVQAIMNYVLQHMYIIVTEYDTTAVKALNRGYGDCFDYSAVFAAFCRANKIPARIIICDRVDAKASGHAVTEVFLEGLGWVPFDPVNIDGGSETFNNISKSSIYLSDNTHSNFLSGCDYYCWSGYGCTVQVNEYAS
jgi:hypothetical protein